ncbi:ABC transporter ATP-binding protein [Paenactinomyces guangxiensis]|uniref:ABC transporter ATP-binding protein n=1 Tax=Paenactinomyces guangxiensis TaxID=1490290 RepID=A0A7W1WSE6_9BACL|nr:ABC transporter ATP-binding protein [Paenactinomyces guangxiensis]MBA4495220.1 ABC transporter ATP-binding protein [Paenactinomyces guangxiensis]MBH8592304.1 ABC transporter ATP-binding protein [Paenactinomyces guangxiensis]
MEPILSTKDLSIQFGGHLAVNGVNATFPERRFTSVIGPNGAGKTTFFNLLSGQIKPTRGKIFFKGMDVTGLSSYKRTRMGIGRSFQITDVFPELTVLENVRLAVQAREKVYYRMFFYGRKYRQLEEKAVYWLKKVFLDQKQDFLARYLTHGEKRKLEIAMLLALETDILLLDEPTAGMSMEEVPVILDLIRRLKEEQERTIILIEHKMDMVLDLSDRVIVLMNGKMLADGTPEEILQNELVQSAYLGGNRHDSRIGTD